MVDVFQQPGECDLTVNVDFAYLKEAVAGVGACSHIPATNLLIASIYTATPLGPLTQEAFLMRMGLPARVEALKRTATSGERAADIERAAKRLVDKTGMGSQYLFMGIVGKRADEEGVKAEERWPFVKDSA